MLLNPVFVFQTFGFGLDGDFGYLWKCLTIVGGIYLFFTLEYVMKMVVRFKEAGQGETEKVRPQNLALP